MPRTTPTVQLELVPIMNLVTILIPFLLMSAAFTSVAVVDVNARPAGDSDNQEHERPKVVISETGFLFTTSEGTTEHLPCPKACQSTSDYDLEGLRSQLKAHKDRRPEGTALELITGDEVPYDVLIAVMDTSRRDGSRDLYPDVLFGSLPQG